jgi:hypothetical protein
MKQNIFTAMHWRSSCWVDAPPNRSEPQPPHCGTHPHTDKIVVCSDIHIGVEDAYAENVANRPYLSNSSIVWRKPPTCGTGPQRRLPG